MKRIAVMVLLVFLLPSCAKGYRPLVDPASIVDRGRYERDLSECGVIADENVRSHQAATGAAGGALWGAGLGALLSWIFGGSAGIGAAGGAVLGGVGGAAWAGRRRARARPREIMRRFTEIVCLVVGGGCFDRAGRWLGGGALERGTAGQGVGPGPPWA
jgi:hypothetical protein